jgi:hypothetical protein
MPNDRSGNCKENPDVQIPKSTLKPCRSEFFTEWCAPWMNETLAGSALMKEASKCSETLQEYRSGYDNPVGEFASSDLKQISLDLSFTESRDVPYGSTTSQSADKYRMMITLHKIPQADGPAPANKTQLSEWP